MWAIYKSQQGHTYLLNFICHLTGWADCYPISNKRGETVANILQREYIPRYGACEVLVSDGGGEFVCQAFRDVCKAAGIDHRTTTPYRPQSNSKIERFHRTLKGLLERLMAKHQSNWETQLGPALAAYRSTATSSDGMSPFQKLYGRQMRPTLSQALRATPSAAEDMQDDRVAHMITIWHQARQALVNERAVNEQQQRKHRLTGPLNIGDQVILLIPGLKRTFHPRWDARWQVIRAKHPVYWIHHIPTGQQKVIHRDKLHGVPPNTDWDVPQTQETPGKQTHQHVWATPEPTVPYHTLQVFLDTPTAPQTVPSQLRERTPTPPQTPPTTKQPSPMQASTPRDGSPIGHSIPQWESAGQFPQTEPADRICITPGPALHPPPGFQQYRDSGVDQDKTPPDSPDQSISLDSTRTSEYEDAPEHHPLSPYTDQQLCDSHLSSATSQPHPTTLSSPTATTPLTGISFDTTDQPFPKLQFTQAPPIQPKPLPSSGSSCLVPPDFAGFSWDDLTDIRQAHPTSADQPPHFNGADWLSPWDSATNVPPVQPQGPPQAPLLDAAADSSPDDGRPISTTLPDLQTSTTSLHTPATRTQTNIDSPVPSTSHPTTPSAHSTDTDQSTSNLQDTGIPVQPSDQLSSPDTPGHLQLQSTDDSDQQPSSTQLLTRQSSRKRQRPHYLREHYVLGLPRTHSKPKIQRHETRYGRQRATRGRFAVVDLCRTVTPSAIQALIDYYSYPAQLGLPLC